MSHPATDPTSYPAPDPYPPYPPGAVVPYAQVYAAGPPVSIKVIGIVGVVLASLAILIRGVGLALLFAMPGAYAPYGPGYRWFQLADTAAFVAAAAVLGAGSVACLTRRAWGRRAMLGWAAIYPVLLVAEAAVTIAWVLPTVAASQPAGPARSVIVASGIVTTVLMTLALCVLPAFVLVLFRRPAVRAAFA